MIGIKDIDLKIIQKLTDNEISIVCRVNKYVSKLCEDETFWLNRLLTKNSAEKISELKGSLKYKQLYRYLYADYKKGLNGAIKNDNVYLYKYLFRHAKMDIYKVVMSAANLGSLEILNYLFINTDGIKDNMMDSIYTTTNEKTIKWMDKMSLINWSSYLSYWIEFSTSDDDSYPYEIIKKYLSKIEDSDNFMYFLGESVEVNGLYFRKKIFDLFLENNINDYEYAIKAAEENVKDKNKLK